MYCIVLVTCPPSESEKIAHEIVSKKYAACANIINNINSIYWWEGKVLKDKESLIIIKTKDELFKKVEQEIKKIHPYKVPEIIKLEIKDANKDYLAWIDESVIRQEIGAGKLHG